MSGMTVSELRSLPVAVDLPTAARAFGLGRTTAYELERRGDFPVEVLRCGRLLRVRRADLLKALGVTDDWLEDTG